MKPEVVVDLEYGLSGDPNSGSRLVVQQTIHDELVDAICRVAKKARLGDPSHPATHIGPIANKPHFERVLQDIESAKTDGADCVLGGQPVQPEGCAGWFIGPTVFTGVTPDMRLAREEVFGPVLAVMTFEDEHEAARIANQTVYGLAAGLWTADTARAIRVTERIDAGTIYINNYFNATTQSPVGGFKQSGYGRENGIEGMKAFLQTKSVWLATTLDQDDPFD